MQNLKQNKKQDFGNKILRETFGLSDQELKQLDKGTYKLKLVDRTQERLGQVTQITGYPRPRKSRQPQSK